MYTYRESRLLAISPPAFLSRLARRPLLMMSSAFEIAAPFSAMLPAAMWLAALLIAARAPSYSMTISLCGDAEITEVSSPTLA